MNITITKSGITATINLKGAELISLKNDFATEYIWEGNPDFWGKHSPVLFPIVGALKNNAYQYNGKTFNLPRHGFAREMNFHVVGQSESEVSFSLTSSEQTMSIYPFAFELQLTYSIRRNGLNISYKVFNHNHFEMPFSIGAHPAFALPGNFGDYSIEMEKAENLNYHLLENDLISYKTESISLSGRKFPLGYQLFENDALVFKSLQSNSLTIHKNSTPWIKVVFSDFPNLGIWTKPNAPFICIEPWFGYADTLSANGNIMQKEAIQVLAENGVFEAGFDIEIF